MHKQALSTQNGVQCTYLLSFIVIQLLATVTVSVSYLLLLLITIFRLHWSGAYFKRSNLRVYDDLFCSSMYIFLPTAPITTIHRYLLCRAEVHIPMDYEYIQPSCRMLKQLAHYHYIQPRNIGNRVFEKKVNFYVSLSLKINAFTFSKQVPFERRDIII